MGTQSKGGVLWELYRKRVGEPETHDEVRGYWVFLTGLLLGTVGFLLFLGSSTATGSGFTIREASIFVTAVGLAMLVAGPVIRLPLQSWANTAAYLGQAVAFVAAVWFLLVFPGDWSVQTGNQPVIVLYVVGLAVITLGGVVAPLVVGTTREELAASEGRAAELESELADVRAERDELAAERDDLESALEEAREAGVASDAAGEELQSLVDSLRASQARFELYEDESGEWRWRLRHRNGNVVATGGEGYTRKHNAQKGLASVRANALGATVIQIESEAELPAEDEAFEPVEEVESRATFEVFTDNRGETRWRLRHDNGNIVADSAEGYGSENALRTALDRVKQYAGPGEYLRIDPTAFEVYRDAGGQWRWRLVHKNGNILGDSGQGYTRRRDARRAVDRIRDSIDDMAFEVYEDDAGEHRWRLTSGNSVVADGGEGYESKSGAEDAVERVRQYAPDADALDIGWAAFEVYEDEAGEWRWRLRARNGNVMADGGEGYASRTNAQDAVEKFKLNAPNADVEDAE